MSATTTLELPLDVLEAARLTVEDLKVEIAIHLYATNRLGFGKARELAGLSHARFRHLIAGRGITVHLDALDVADELASTRRSETK